MILHVDFETSSCISLRDQGLDRYVRDKSTKVLMLAYAFGDGEIELWEPRLGQMPKELCRAINSDVTLVAWNSTFERSILREVLKINIPVERFCDPSTFARHLSLPDSLQSVGDILGLGEEGKDKEGKRLIDLFCKPHYEKVRPRVTDENVLFDISPLELPKPKFVFMDHKTHPEDWEKFKEYCKQDVRTERKLMHDLEPFKLPEIEKKIWYLDQRINDTGLPVNREFARKAYGLALRSKEEFATILKEKTGVENPNSGDQMLKWLGGQGYTYGSIEKNTVTVALNDARLTPLAREVLTLRAQGAKTSYTKLETLLETLYDDDFLRHQFVYLGAARTGRWAGFGFQFQNQPRPIKEVEDHPERAMELIDAEDYKTIKVEYPSVIGMAVSCVRSAFQAPKGKKLVVCDESAIENRVIGWLSGCQAILQVFHEGRDPYVAFGVKMYNQPYEILLKDKPKRQIAKPAVLAAGFGLGPGVRRVCRICGKSFGFKDYCKKCKTNECEFQPIMSKNKYGDLVKTGLLAYAERMGVKMTPAQAWTAWRAFRRSYPEVVEYWKVLQSAAMQVIVEGGEVRAGVVTFGMTEVLGKSVMRITLPSGRNLHYMNPSVTTREMTGDDGEPYNNTVIVYDGIGHGVATADKEDGGQGSKWGPVYTYGGKLCENIVQAIARDVLANAMLLADEAGANIIGHVHDEILVLSDDNPLDFGLEDLKYCMSVTPSWAEGLPLAAEGFESRVYRKG